MGSRSRRMGSRSRSGIRMGKKSKRKTRVRGRRRGGGVGESSRQTRAPRTTYRRHQGPKFRPSMSTYRAPRSGARRFGRSARPYRPSDGQTGKRWFRRPVQRKRWSDKQADELVDKLLKLGGKFDSDGQTQEDKEKLTKEYARLLSNFGVTVELDPGPTTRYVKAVQRKLKSIAAHPDSNDARQRAAARHLAYLMPFINESGQHNLEGQDSPAQLSTSINIYGDSIRHDRLDEDGRPLERYPLYTQVIYSGHDSMPLLDALASTYGLHSQD